MLTSLQTHLTRWSRWPVMLGLLVLCALIVGVLFPLLSPTAATADITALDTRLWYTRADVAAHMDTLTSAGRNAAALSHLTADLLFPLAYGALLAMLLLKTWPQSGLWKLALADVAADLMENISLAALYWTHPRLLDSLAPLAAWWTALKWALIALTFVFILLGAVNRWRSR
ncbi:MAG: hypothetical protein Fur0018_22380 [Anaerolineales bacterium]